MHYKILKLNDVWRTCNKIRSAIFRVNLDLWEYFLPFDVNKTCLISESQFCSVLSGSLRSVLGLCDQEITDLADYFKVPDGRILYTQFCEVITNNLPNFAKNADLVSGLEWEDPLQCNRLSMTEERRLNILMTKLAVQVNMKKLVLRPYFQDYELLSKNNGTITIAHFARILSYHRILISADDFNLIVKKYVKDGYTINYVAFVAALDIIVNDLNEKGMMDLGGDLVSQFPGKLISVELPKLPRPEIGTVPVSDIFGKQSAFHPAIDPPKPTKNLITLIRNIQKHVLINRLRVYEFFRDFDVTNVGRITTSQFHRGLDALGISGLNKLFLSLPEIEVLTIQYRDPLDNMRVCWRTFEDDIEQVFTTKELEKTPSLEIESPPKAVTDLPRTGAKVWQNVSSNIKDVCEEVLIKIRQRTTKRAIVLKPLFGDYDIHKNGHVSRYQMRQCLSVGGILLSEEEIFALEQRYNDDVGFNYFWFLREMESKYIEPPLYAGLYSEMKKLQEQKPLKIRDRKEKDIVCVLAKIKGKVVRDRIRVLEFLKDYDVHTEYVIPQSDFKRGVNNAGITLTDAEYETLFEVFGSVKRSNCVDYRRFASAIEEAFTQSSLEKAPLAKPIQLIPTNDCERNFLNFEERKIMCMALQKLSNKPDTQINILTVLEDLDKINCGTLTVNQFSSGLGRRGMLDLISRKEFDIICKGFGFMRGLRDEVDYRAFVKAIDILHATNKYLPF
ncbi:hypothetical protein FQA39_LY00664 [Lamprigera yunnana]|nr:hypothetical protein FQA39_LY00664 [Lamprigera yunnana]